jgi:uncharacterized protein (TIGR02231 family)
MNRHRRSALLSAATAALLSALAAGPARAAEGGVSAVVVYPDRALVTRLRTVECEGREGRATAAFAAIPPAADPGSFRATAHGGTVQGLRFEAKARSQGYGAEWKTLEATIQKLERERRVLHDARARNDGAAALGDSYAATALTLIGREMVAPDPNVTAWKGAVEAALGAKLQASAATAAVDAQLGALEPKLEDLRRRQAQLAAAGQRSEYLAEVMVSCSGKARVELTYLVGGAGWTPAYEARLDDAGAIQLGTFGTISQTTGEDWKDARLTLSTAVPRQNATPPEIAPLKVYADERTPPRKALVSRSEQHQRASAPVSAAGAGGAGGPRLGIADQGISVQMTLPQPADVAGDGTPARLLVARTPLSGQLHHRSAPKFMPFVFRVADLTNIAPFPLLAGPVDAFRKGDFLGRYRLQRTAVGDRLTLTFGVEESVKVKRTTVEELQREKGLLGGVRHHRYEYTVEVGNYLGRPQDVEITEQVPVSELDDVKVVIDAKTTGGYKLGKDDGLLTWKVKLAAGEKRQLRLAFRIEAPDSYLQ